MGVTEDIDKTARMCKTRLLLLAVGCVLQSCSSPNYESDIQSLFPSCEIHVSDQELFETGFGLKGDRFILERYNVMTKKQDTCFSHLEGKWIIPGISCSNWKWGNIDSLAFETEAAINYLVSGKLKGEVAKVKSLLSEGCYYVECVDDGKQRVRLVVHDEKKGVLYFFEINM